MMLLDVEEDVLKVPSVCFKNAPADNLIKEGDHVIIRKDKFYKFTTVQTNRPELCEKAKFRFDTAIGKPYGSLFQICNHELEHVTDRRQYDNFGIATASEAEGDQSGKDNRNLSASAANQMLKPDDITQLRAEGKTGAEIITHLIENSSSFADKTAFSQEKYVHKKKKKHMNIISILRPCTRVICELYAARGIQKVLGLRMDTIAYLLAHANVHSSSNVLMHETCAGLLMGAVLERQGGRGRLLHFHHGTAPTRPEMHVSQLRPDALQLVHDIPLQEATALRLTCNYARHAQAPPRSDSDRPAKQPRTSVEPEPSDDGEKEMDELARRRLEKKTRLATARTVLLSEPWHALIVASKFHPTAILLSLLHFLSPAAPFVVYCQRMQPLVELFELLKRRGDALMMELSDGWLRYYQVLPDRTHPEMSSNHGGGGYLLTGYNGCGEHGKTRPPEADYLDGLLT